MNLFFFFFFYTFLCLGLLRLSKPPLFSSTFITLVVVVFWILAKIWSLVLETLTGILFKSLICICCCNCSGTPRKKSENSSIFLRWRDFTSFLFVQTISREFWICVQNIYFYVPVVGLLEPPEDPELVLIVLPEVIVLPPEVVLSLCCCTILICSICLAMSLILAALALFDLLLCNLKENIDFT